MLKKTKRCHAFADGVESDVGHFIDEFLAQRPEVGENRTQGWYQYGDRRVDLDELK